jgi:phage repressor protein C with HTH and peptisase S24 domain
MQRLGLKLRQQRRKLGLTLDDLAARTSISKPYLSLIETGRVPNPPSDDKLRRLEQTLGFNAGELVTHADLHRTPAAIRAVLNQLLQGTDLTGDDPQLATLLQQFTGTTAGAIPGVIENPIPIINSPSTGYPRDFNDLNYPSTVATDFVNCPGLVDPEAFAVRVAGDRMTPRFFDGDIVIFSPVITARNGDDCFVRFDDGHTTFVRVFFETGDSNESVVRLQPRNEKYRPHILAKDRVAGAYRAVYRQHRLDDSATA